MTDSRRIENGGHELTIVHHRRDTCAGKAFRTQLVAKRSQGGNVDLAEALAVGRRQHPPSSVSQTVKVLLIVPKLRDRAQVLWTRVQSNS